MKRYKRQCNKAGICSKPCPHKRVHVICRYKPVRGCPWPGAWCEVLPSVLKGWTDPIRGWSNKPVAKKRIVKSKGKYLPDGV